MEDNLLKQYRQGINPPYTARKRDILAVGATLFILLILPLTVLLIQTSREPASKAAELDPIFIGAGDIAGSNPEDNATAAILDSVVAANPENVTVFTTGDNAYPDGTTSEFNNYYHPSWGKHKAITKPSAGNHDYHVSGASGYFSYFGSAAGSPGGGYYSYNLGSWHIIALNSNISTTAGSAQEQWLRADLAANQNKACVAAYWHHPRFTSGSIHGNADWVSPLYQALYEYKADLILTGHNHHYERFAPQDHNGVGRSDGVTQFVIGSGGSPSIYAFSTPKANSLVRYNGGHGVVKFTLKNGSYDWEFLSVAGKTFNDKSTAACVGAGGGNPPPPPMVQITSPANGSTVSGTVGIAAIASGVSGISKVEFSVDGTLINTDTSSPFSYPWNSITATNGNHTISAKAYDGAGNTPTHSVTVTVNNVATPTPLPSPWQTSDIGAVGLTGLASYSNSTFTVSGSGADIWGTADQFRYVYQSFTGNGSIIARIARPTNNDAWSKAGVMIRETTAANSKSAIAFVTPVTGGFQIDTTSLQYRSATGGTTAHTAGQTYTAPVYLKLERNGSTIKASQSNDGVTYTQIGSQTISMTNAVTVGLAVSSHNNAALSQATFTNVSVTSDSDGDGFSDAIETFIGTNPAVKCGNQKDNSLIGSPNLNWPPDVWSKDKSANKVDIQDVTGMLAPVRRLDVTANYNKRYDLNADGAITVDDINILTDPRWYNKVCS